MKIQKKMRCSIEISLPSHRLQFWKCLSHNFVINFCLICENILVSSRYLSLVRETRENIAKWERQTNMRYPRLLRLSQWALPSGIGFGLGGWLEEVNDHLYRFQKYRRERIASSFETRWARYSQRIINDWKIVERSKIHIKIKNQRSRITLTVGILLLLGAGRCVSTGRRDAFRSWNCLIPNLARCFLNRHFTGVSTLSTL